MSLSYTFLDPEQILRSEDFSIIRDFLKITKRTNIGWHYIVDLTWIYSQVKNWPRNYRVLDAGGGHGPTQFLLAELGFDVVNIDLVLPRPRLAYEQRYSMQLRKLDSHVDTIYTSHLHGVRKYRALARSFYNEVTEYKLISNVNSAMYSNRQNKWRKKYNINNIEVGNISWVNGNLSHLPEIEASTFDAVVSLSSLEHIPLESLSPALLEIKRILKPDAHYVITTSATVERKTWFHEPSKGLCFSSKDLEDIFKAVGTNKENVESILLKYKASIYLKNNLAKFYKQSGDNGMPWGVWDPKYVPVAIWC